MWRYERRSTSSNEETSMTSPRIHPTEPPYPAAVAAAFERVMPPGVPPLTLFRALAVNERVFLRVMAGGLLDRGSLTLRERELVIDRTCFRCGSEYEWGVHVTFFGARVGLTTEETRDLCAEDPRATVFAPREQLLLALCDELHATANVSDALWTALAAEWSPEQLVELVVLAGYYHLVAFATNALRLPLEPAGARFAG
jgi:alkylhydroperoxidase family enzyme